MIIAMNNFLNLLALVYETPIAKLQVAIKHF